MNVGYVFDDGFVLPASVSIYSLLENNGHIHDLKLFVLDDNISDNNKNLLLSMVEKFDRVIEFVNISKIKDKLSNTTKYNWHGSYSTYIRLMLNSIFPNCNDRIIMIDADTIVTGNIEALELLDMKDNACAMALEAMPISYYIHSKLGMNKLVNGGLIVIDLKKWSDANAEQKIIDFIVNVREKNMLTDEDVLSAVFKDKISIIPPKYNFLAQYTCYSNKFFYKFFGWKKLYENNAFYSLDDLIEAKNDPVILHCIDMHTNRPWHSNNNHPFSGLFDSYLAKTPWDNSDKNVKSMSMVAKIEFFLRKYLPGRLSDYYYACVLRLYYGIGAKKYYG